VIGLFGGTFDPVHLGHLDVARAARRALNLDRVWMIPAKIPPHRGRPLATEADRVAMLTQAIQNEPGFEISTVELDAPGPSYTAHTLARLGIDGSALDRWCFITGADAFSDIATWFDYPALLDRCHFAVVSRPGCGVHALPAALPSLASRMVSAGENPVSAASRPGIFLIDAPTAPVSSTSVRAAITRGLPLTGLVPDAVADYIASHRLYLEAHGR
jgi:nicotinate-nucleotide adenylyltransferase